MSEFSDQLHRTFEKADCTLYCARREERLCPFLAMQRVRKKHLASCVPACQYSEASLSLSLLLLYHYLPLQMHTHITQAQHTLHVVSTETLNAPVPSDTQTLSSVVASVLLDGQWYTMSPDLWVKTKRWPFNQVNIGRMLYLKQKRVIRYLLVLKMCVR